MSNTLIDQSVQSDPSLAPGSQPNPEALQSPLEDQLPVGVIALQEIGIQRPLPPTVETAVEATAERRRDQGIDAHTVRDLHIILSDDPTDVEAKSAARRRLDRGTITEKALAYSVDVLLGSTYDKPGMIDPPDTRATAGARSRQLAIHDPQNEFIKEVEKMSIWSQRKLSDETYQKICELESTTKHARIMDPKQGASETTKLQDSGLRNLYYWDEKVATEAVGLILAVADRLDASLVYELLRRAPKQREVVSAFSELDSQDVRNFEKLLAANQAPSVADAYLVSLLAAAELSAGRKAGHVNQFLEENPDLHPAAQPQKVEAKQKQLQESLARVNQSRGYTGIELDIVCNNPDITEEEFGTLHTLRNLVASSMYPGNLPILQKYIVEDPQAMQLVEGLGKENMPLEQFTFLSQYVLRLSPDKRLEQVSAEEHEVAEEAFQLFVKYMTALPSVEQQHKEMDKLLNDLRMINYGEFRRKGVSSLWNAEFLKWTLTELPSLQAGQEGLADTVTMANGWFKALTQAAYARRVDALSDEAAAEKVKAGLLIMQELPKGSIGYDYLRAFGEKAGGFVETLISDEAGAKKIVETIKAVDESMPEWITPEAFRYFTDMTMNLSESEMKPRIAIFQQMKDSGELGASAQHLLLELIQSDSVMHGYKLIGDLCKPENRDALNLLADLKLQNFQINLYASPEGALDALRPIAQQLRNHPVMSLLTDTTLPGRRGFMNSLFEADDPMVYGNALLQGAKLFGDLNTPELTDLLYNVYMGGDLLKTEEQEVIKIVGEGGQPGIDKLTAHLNKFREKVFADALDLDLLEHSHLHLSYLKALTRYDQSTWGSHYDDALILQIKHQLESDDQSKFQLIDEDAYQPSEVLRVAEIDQDALDNFEITKDGLSQWQEINGELADSLAVMTSRPEKAGEIIAELSTKIAAHIERLEAGKLQLQQKLEAMPEAKRTKLQTKLDELAIEIDELREIDDTTLMNVTRFLQNTSVLAKYKDMHSPIRKVLFMAALTKFPQEVARAQKLTAIENPSLKDLESLEEFTQHITNQETWGEAFQNFGLYKAMNNVLAINAVNENIVRGLNIGTAGTRELQFRPTRGLLMELSGHIADACWASRYDSIAEQFPNFTSVSIIQRPGTKDARLAGAGFLVEAQTDTGRPILVIRGLNPIQNMITQLDAEDFFNQFVDYARQIAKKRGMGLAVVIDGQSGGSATNRPSLFEHLDRKVRPTLFKQSLADSPVTTFNGYDITNNCYWLA